MEKKRTFIDDIMDTVIQTDEWMDIQMKNPKIKEADDAFYAVLNSLRNIIDEKVWIKLEETAQSCVATVSFYAVLYGMHVSDSLRCYAANSPTYSAAVITPEERGATLQ